MGKCNYCGNNAGWFSSQHAECQGKHDSALRELRQRAAASASGRISGRVMLPEFLDVLREYGDPIPPPGAAEDVELRPGEMLAFVRLRVPTMTT